MYENLFIHKIHAKALTRAVCKINCFAIKMLSLGKFCSVSAFRDFPFKIVQLFSLISSYVFCSLFSVIFSWRFDEKQLKQCFGRKLLGESSNLQNIIFQNDSSWFQAEKIQWFRAKFSRNKYETLKREKIKKKTFFNVKVD